MVEFRANADNGFEFRSSGDGMTFSGYAAVFDSPSEPLPFIETIAPGAFRSSLQSRNQVKMFVNHDSNMVLASTRSGSLRLAEDSKGLFAEADLPNTTYARDLAVMMRRGDVTSMSFGFSVPNGGDQWADGATRRLNTVRLHEVSVVTGFPAYEGTSAQLRSIDVLAERTALNADDLAVALTLLENAVPLTIEQADLVADAARKLTTRFDDASKTSLGVLSKHLDLLGKK
jgi:HK97 family phage prohead protease